MIDVAPDPAEKRWWADLEPSKAVSRPELVRIFARLSLDRFKLGAPKRARIDLSALTNQINAFSVELARQKWARDSFTVDGVRCMQARVKESLGEPEDLRGWSRVLDVYGRFCDPLAHYVIGFYPPLYDLRPSGLPRNVMSSLKDGARYGACNALRDGLLTDFGRGRPLLDGEDRVATFIEAAAGKSSESEMHRRDILLAYAVELYAYAKKIAVDPWRVLDKEPSLIPRDVAAMAMVITTRADEIRASFAGEVPSMDECRTQADNLLTQVNGYMIDTTQQIAAITAANADERTSGSAKLAALNAESEHFAAAYESTRDQLIALLSRGHDKTEHDALRMFLGRVRPAVKRGYAAKRGKAGTPFEGGTPNTKPSATAGSTLYHRLRDTLVAHRDELPNGLGALRNGADIGEYAATVELFDRGVTDLVEITDFCSENWSTYAKNAIAGDTDELAEHVADIMRWTAKRSGLR